jgi:hypothetical protein
VDRLNKRIDDLRVPMPLPPAKPSWKSSPWLIALTTGIIGCIVGGFIVASWQSSQNHSSEDLKRDINLEVARQLAPIQSDLSHQIQEFRKQVSDQLTAQDEKVSRIQGALGIAQNSNHGDGLEKFAAMKLPDLRKNLPALTSAVKLAQESKARPSLDTVVSIQNRIAHLNLDSPESVQAAEAVINFASHLREISNLVPDVALARVMHCRLPPGMFIGSVISGCTVDLDGQSFENVAFENCIVRYNGGPVHLVRATFTNCLYAIALPTTLSAPAKKVIESILAASGQKPSVTVTSG